MTNSNFHWLAGQLGHLGELAARQGMPTDGDENVVQLDSRSGRDDFMSALHLFADDVADRRGVLSCVVGHEGLVLAAAGQKVDSEGLAALSQMVMTTVRLSSAPLQIGDLQQLLVVGEEQKIALFQVGEMTVAIQARTGVDLARSLAEP